MQKKLVQNNMEYLVSDDINQDDAVLRRIKRNTLGISLGVGWKFSPNFIECFRGKLWNIHGSGLPSDRRGGEFRWRILRNDRVGINLVLKFLKITIGATLLLVKQYLFSQNVFDERFGVGKDICIRQFRLIVSNPILRHLCEIEF